MKGYAAAYPFNYANIRFLFEISRFGDTVISGGIFDDLRIGQRSVAFLAYL